MSALAKYFHATGKAVAGYDRCRTTLTDELKDSGIGVHYDDDPELIPKFFRHRDETLVVYTPAIPNDCSELIYFRTENFHILKRAEVLGMITRNKKSICIAGSHGKTTVTTMIAHLFHQSDTGCSAFLGGISKNYGSNMLLSRSSDYVVVEADEYDRSFLKLNPEIAVVTSVDADHLDIYGTKEEVIKSFEAFLLQIHRGGKLVIKKGAGIQAQNPGVDVFTFALHEKADFYAEHIRLEQGKYHFDVVTPVEVLKNMSLEHPGIINVENAVAAVAVATLAGLHRNEIREAVNTFTGVKRRFDYIFRSKKAIYIDDYAHHPREIDAVIGSVRKLYPEKKITGIFQPHLYSRTRDFAMEFAVSLGKLDELILLDIYPARELPVEGVGPELIFSNVTLKEKSLIMKEDLLKFIAGKDIEILITMGAGDIDQLVEPLRIFLNKKYGG